MKKQFIEGIHYYFHEGKIVMTEEYHKERGFCCGSKCLHCPYLPKWEKGSTKIEEEQ